MKRFVRREVQSVVQVRCGHAIPVTKPDLPFILDAKADPRPHADGRIVHSACDSVFNKWSFGVVKKDKATEKKLPTSGSNALQVQGTKNAIAHQKHSRSEIAKANISEYERSIVHSKTRNFLDKRAPLPDHPLHQRTSDPMELRHFLEKYSLDLRQMTNANPLGPVKISTPLEKKVEVAAVKK